MIIKGLLSSTISILSAGILWGSVGMWVTAVLILLVLLAYFYQTQGIVNIPDMTVGVVYHRETKAFSRFLPMGKHRINPMSEVVSEMISTASASAKGRCHNAQTIGGISLTVDWSLGYTVDPFTAKSSPAKLARVLPTKAEITARKHTNNCIHHIIGEYTVEQLCQPGAHKRLEREIRQLVSGRLTPLGFDVSRVMVGAVEMPPHVKDALETAQKQQLHIENEAKALERLHKVISQFSEDDMQRLMELERINKMGQNGVALMYPTMDSRTAVPAPQINLRHATAQPSLS